MHDRKQLGLLEIGLLDRRIIRKQPRRRSARRADSSSAPARRAAPSISPFASMSEIVRSAGTGLQVDRPAAALIWARSSRPGSSSPPRRHLMSRGLTPYSSSSMPRTQTFAVIWYSGMPMRLALEVRRRFDAAVGADVDAGVPEQPRHEGRDGDVVRLAARQRQQIAAHRDFGDVELLEFEGAVERLLGRIRHRDDVAALDRRAAVEDRRGAVVVADGQAQFQRHSSVSRRRCCGKLPYHTAIACVRRAR